MRFLGSIVSFFLWTEYARLKGRVIVFKNEKSIRDRGSGFYGKKQSNRILIFFYVFNKKY